MKRLFTAIALMLGLSYTPVPPAENPSEETSVETSTAEEECCIRHRPRKGKRRPRI